MTFLDATATSILSALLVASIKVAALLALAALTTIAFRRRSAALKHMIWTVALGATVFVLLLPAVLPAWRVLPLPAMSLSAAAPEATDGVTPSRGSASDEIGASALVQPHTDTRAPAAKATASSLLRRHWPPLAFSIWLIGGCVVLVRFAYGALALRRLARKAQPMHGPIAVRAHNVASRLQINRDVAFLTSDEVELPLTWGIARPRVLLPADASDWSESRVAYVLQHELAHVKRIDAATQLVSLAAATLFWFHPLVWFAVAEMRRERERACDDNVLLHGAVASAYAADLLALVRTYGHIDRYATALAMARRSQFEGRLLALLDPAVEHTSLSRRHVGGVLAVSALLLVPVTILRATEAAPIVPAAQIETAPRATLTLVTSTPTRSSAQPPPVQEVTQPSQAIDLFAGCVGKGASHDHRNLVNGQTLWVASANDGDCSYELTAHGDIIFNDDVTAIATIPAGGDIDITTSVHGMVTRLRARADADGAITYEFSRDGAVHNFGAAGQAWLADFLVELDRHTGLAIDRRFPALWRTGGATLVLDEIERIHAEHAKMLYLTELAAVRALDSASIRRLVAATASMRSDHPKVEVLVALARSQSLSADNRRDYVALASMLEAGHDRPRVLSAISQP